MSRVDSPLPHVYPTTLDIPCVTSPGSATPTLRNRAPSPPDLPATPSLQANWAAGTTWQMRTATRLHFWMLQYLTLDLFDQKGQVGAGEAQVGGWNAMVLDVRRDVLVVRMSHGQGSIMGVWP